MAKSGWKKAKALDQDRSALLTKTLSREVAPEFSSQESESKDVFTKRANRLDPLTERLGCTSYFHKMRWPWLTYHFGGLDHPLDVSRFYQEKNLAIDINPKDQRLVKHKAVIFAKQNIQYVVLENAADFVRLEKGMS